MTSPEPTNPESINPKTKTYTQVEYEGAVGTAPTTPGTPYRFRAKRKQLRMFSGILPERQGQTLDVTVLHVPYSLSSGTPATVQGYLAHKKQRPPMTLQ